MFCLVIGLLVLACGSPDTNRNNTNRSLVVTGEPIGVPECDSFLNAYEICISNNVPEGQRAQFQTTMSTWRSDWKKYASDPQSKPGLIAACKKHLEVARASMKQYNCTF